MIIGVLIGRLQKSGKKTSTRKTILWALVAGALNAANAYAVYILTPAPTFRGLTTTGTTFARTASATSGVGFTISSFIAGFLIVAAVFAVAALYGRIRKGESESEPTEESESQETEELSKLKTG